MSQHGIKQNSGISRRKIIKSQQAGLGTAREAEEESDVWHDKDSLYAHHLKEVLDKWNDIDDEIWGKIICVEKNRRVAKAYARVPVLTINGSDDGFDGFRIGVCGFENGKRQEETIETHKTIGDGIKIKLDQEGNLFIKKLTEADVCVREYSVSDSCLSEDVQKAQGQLETGKPAKVFDMKRFIQNIAHELKGPYLNRRKLELQCFTSIFFGQNDTEDILDAPCWVMVINIVALDMLRSQLPEAVYAMVGSHNVSRAPAMMENVSASRFLSTPRDEHYPRSHNNQARAQKKTNKSVDPPYATTENDAEDRRTDTLKRPISRISPTSSVYGMVSNHTSYPFLPVLNQQYQRYQLPLDQSTAHFQYRQPLQSYQGLSAKNFPDTDDMRRWSSYTNVQNALPLGLSSSRQLYSEWE
ncbi:hypothetical protein RvY_01117 [Ramazzottius varieornatus]|uniref:MH2 domain-containing protein n=1 Tax=Ramazzottius varieornatus TaxID=947166 RepID=A0A1D1UF62_RAMVA|nr:hypothetical protein RvY_01117 [Ramazzottius varieornatus]